MKLEYHMFKYLACYTHYTNVGYYSSKFKKYNYKNISFHSICTGNKSQLIALTKKFEVG